MLHKPTKVKTELLSFRIDVSLLDKIKEQCLLADVSLSEGLRQLLEQALNSTSK